MGASPKSRHNPDAIIRSIFPIQKENGGRRGFRLKIFTSKMRSVFTRKKSVFFRLKRMPENRFGKTILEFQVTSHCLTK